MTGAGEEAEKQPAPLVRLGAFVMTHNRVDVLPGTLRKIIDQTFPPEKVLVIDNASSDGTADVVKSLDDSRLSYVRLEENAGPAGAAKTGIEWARNQGFDWVYWGDDDDPPKQDDAFERLLGIASVEGSEDVGALGMWGMRWDWTRGRTVLVPDEDCSGAVEVDVVGGNHTLMIGRAAFEAVEPPRAELFFGFEEPEYCLRIRGAGLRILVDGDSMLDARRQGGVLGLTKRSEWTARNPEWRPVRPQRQYYSTRNYIYSMRRSFGRPDLARRELVRAVLRTVYAWRFGPRYAVSFDWHQLRGVIDGYRGHMGRRIVLG